MGRFRSQELVRHGPTKYQLTADHCTCPAETYVLSMHLHCWGCWSKFLRCFWSHYHWWYQPQANTFPDLTIYLMFSHLSCTATDGSLVIFAALTKTLSVISKTSDCLPTSAGALHSLQTQIQQIELHNWSSHLTNVLQSQKMSTPTRVLRSSRVTEVTEVSAPQHTYLRMVATYLPFDAPWIWLCLERRILKAKWPAYFSNLSHVTGQTVTLAAVSLHYIEIYVMLARHFSIVTDCL